MKTDFIIYLEAWILHDRQTLLICSIISQGIDIGYMVFYLKAWILHDRQTLLICSIISQGIDFG